MTMALHKGHSVATAGLAAITGAGVALGFTVFDSTTSLTSTSLAIASLVMVCLSVVLTVLYFGFAAIPDPSGLVGVVAGTAIIWSDRHRGRWSSLGLGLSLLYLGASIGTPVYLGAYLVKVLVYTATRYGYGWVALALVGLAVWNIFKWRQGGSFAALGDS